MLPTCWCPHQPLAHSTPNAQARLLCFHSAGSDHTIFLSKLRTPTAKLPSAPSLANSLTHFCAANNVQLICPVLPGRPASKQPLVDSDLPPLATRIFNDFKDLLQYLPPPSNAPLPYFLAGHSMGCFLLFHFLNAILTHRQSVGDPNFPFPKAVFLSSSVPPSLPLDQRPWTPAAQLPSDQLFQQSLLKWNVNPAVFKPSLWNVFGHTIRQDFQLLDQTQPHPPLHIPDRLYVHLFLGKYDQTITPALMNGWRNCLVGENIVWDFVELEGSHAIFYEGAARESWSGAVCSRIREVMEESMEAVGSSFGF